MERYRLRSAPKDRQRTLLLPLSYGVSSLALLHMLSSILARQRLIGQHRTAFDLHIVVVNPASLEPSGSHVPERLDQLRAAYPGNKYTELPLHSILDYDTDTRVVFAQCSRLSIAESSHISNEEAMNLFRASFSTTTARADVDRILLRRLIVAFAQNQGCDGILWGDSDSRLAAKTLANVAKGRGSSIVWDVCDGVSPWGIYFSFPLRDLYKTELELFASYTLPHLEPIIERDVQDFESISNRNMSIEDLMSRYVLTQGAKYPGVMANIVRTIDKLKTPPTGGESRCVLCGVPVGATDNSIFSSEHFDTTILDQLPNCYGCMRTLLDLRTTVTASR
ncbi:Cytoplasmic tRNA 2-thiolation protein 2 [Ophidiomyces ophidiicola]|nr:Cytoplasmic tRNA 2-thiolation protein 2 [Ophidiomyces ophidiicola]